MRVLRQPAMLFGEDEVARLQDLIKDLAAIADVDA
jgi:hypothetical protein